MTSSFDLTDRVIVITGAASGGIGEATALAVVGAGARVVCLDISAEGVERTVAAVGERATGAVLDVRDGDAVMAAADQVIADHGRIDGWVNAAGVVENATVAEMSPEDFNRVFDVNFRGTLYGAQAAVKAMGTRGGSIVNLASTAIDVHAQTLVAYAVSKVGVAELTRTLANEVGPIGIRVNAIAPGFVETKMTARHYVTADGGEDEAIKAALHKPMLDMMPLRRIGEPADIANGIHYLVSDAAKWVTGQTIRINGGASMP